MERRLDREKYPEYVYPEHKPDHSKPERESIVKLGKMITDRIPQKLGIKKITRDDPEYWGLAGVLTDEEAEIALKMGVRKPKTLPEMVRLTGIPARELEPKLQEMSVKGILEYNWENPQREKQYVLPMFVPGCGEFFNMNTKVIEEHPEVTLFFEHMSWGRAVTASGCMSFRWKRPLRWKANLSIWSIFPTGCRSTRGNMRQVPVPAGVLD